MDIDIEKFICERNRPENTVHYGKTKRWKYNTSGILVHSAGLSWDESFFLVFPLLGLKDENEKFFHLFLYK